MFSQFTHFNHQNALFQTDNKILLATSGGVDSVVLAHLLKQSGVGLQLAHCNYQLRGAESEEDEKFVRDLALQLEVKVHVHRFDLFKEKENFAGSVQSIARELRYNWFEELLEKHGLNKIATAHHLGDQVETVLLNLVRGTGISGLQGIPVSRGNIIRPLLFASKEQIYEYARGEGWLWREDSTNQESKYRRNLIRNEVVPVLKRINPGLEAVIARMTNHLGQVEEVFGLEMHKIEKTAVERSGRDVKIDLKKLSHNKDVFIISFLLKYGFNHSQIGDILSGQSSTGLVFDAPLYRLNVDRDVLILSPRQKEDVYVEIQPEDASVTSVYSDFAIRKVAGENYQVQSDASIAALDLKALEFPLIVRKWRKGDAFIPLGMKGKKKLSDFMIDRKIPLNLKERQLILESGGKIAWVVGHQISDEFKVMPGTSDILEIKTLPKNA